MVGYFSILLMLQLVVKESQSNSVGAPSSACGSMTPSHQASPQTGQSPYSVYVSSGQYAAGGQLTVTINGTQQFKGFLLIAKTAAGTSLGSFAKTSVSQQVCSSGLTHKSATNLNSLTVQWSAPDSAQGSVYFYATVVRDYTTFWVALQSSLVWDGQSSTASTTAASSIQGSSISSLSTSGCGSTKSCFTSPGGCTGSDCYYMLTWQLLPIASSKMLQFYIQAQTTSTRSYVSVGFGKSYSMNGMSVVNCVATNNGARVTQTYSQRNEEPAAISSASNLLNITAVATSNLIQCSFVWNNDASARLSTQQFDLTSSYTLIMARGTAVGNSAGNILEHTETPISVTNAIVVASQSYADYSAGASTKTWLKKFHGAMMSAAWVMCSTISVLLARYYKKKWLDSKLCGEKIWFAWHRGLAIACLILTLIAFILIYVAVGGWSSLSSTLMESHAYLGVIVTALAVANPIMGFFRCNPGTKMRKVFNWAHWFVGNAAVVLAGTTLLIGYQIDTTQVCPAWLVYVAAAYVVWFGIAYFALMVEEIVSAKTASAATELADGDNSFQMKSVNPGGSNGDGEVAQPAASPPCSQDAFKGYFFVINLVVTIAVAATLVIAILAY